MVKTVVNKYGSLVIGGCPKCPEKISIYLKKGEHYKNGRCVYCGAEIHGDGIYGLIREGRITESLTGNRIHPDHAGTKNAVDASFPDHLKSTKKSVQEIAEYDEHMQGAGAKRRSFVHRIPCMLLKKTKKPAGG